uniref:Adenylate cyclase (EC) n=1 Tax=uncultured Thiotrichaceae bacterium TaxID=298394 RepID=A0A6S6ULB2_9GAMM|nr:MAG: Adenylate cyclase (EC [uncultured Thiotrichaceae bacterium]
MWQNYKHNLTPFVISLSLLLLFCLLYLQAIPFTKTLLQRLDAIAYDMRIHATAEGEPSGFPPIHIIDIDEKSLEEQGQWPWRRSKLAQLIENLHLAGSAVITLDITLAEPEENPVDLVRKVLGDGRHNFDQVLDGLTQKLNGDGIIANAMKDKSVVLGYLFHQNDSFQKGALKPSLVEADTPLDTLSSLSMQGFTANIPMIAEAATQNGFFTIQPDSDGVVRRAGLLLEFDNQLYTSLAVETAKIYLGAEQEATSIKTQAVADTQAITHAVIAGQEIRTNATGQILIPYLGPSHTFNYISATDVLQGRELPDLTDAIVVVGTSAQALADLRTMPLQPSYPGVEIQATLIHALMNPDLIPYTPEWADGAVIVLMIFLTLLMVLLYPLLRPLSLIIIGTLFLLGVTAFNFWLWQSQRINLELILPLLMVMAISSTYVIHRLIREHNDRQRIHNMFGQYVPPGHIDRLLESKNKLNMAGERREMTVLFSDIRSFTAISEHLTTQQLKEFLNVYLTPITAIIFNKQGTIDKYIGDLVMAFWGAPLDDPNHAEHAVLAALEMRDKTRQMQDEFRALGLTQTVSAGIGIHTGEMNVGDMGSDYRRAYTVLGDAVNLGSRLESLTKQYGITMLASEDTLKQCPNIVFRQVDYARVKGRNEPVRIYEPLCHKDMLTQEQQQQINEHHTALALYIQGDWKGAATQFERLSELQNDPLHQVYLQRMREHDGQAPADWDGVFTHMSK